MDSYKILLEYIKAKIFELTNNAYIVQLRNTLQELEVNLSNFNNDISLVSKELVLSILKENMDEELSIAKYELFLETLTIKDYLNANSEIPQVKLCLELLTNIKTYIISKRDLIKQELERINEENIREIEKYNKYLAFFDNNQLKSNLTKKDLEDLLSFIMDTSINKDIKVNLFIQIGVNQIRLYETKRLEKQQNELDIVRRNTSRISKLLKEVTDITEEKPLEEQEVLSTVSLTQEEQEIYDRIIGILELLKQEKFNLDIEKEYISLIDVNDLSLNQVRKDLYEMPGINPFALMYLDINNRLLNSFNDNKNSIIEIFKYMIYLFDTKYISKKDYKESIPVFSSNEIVEIEKLILEFTNLKESQKNTLFNNEELYRTIDRKEYEELNLELTYEQFSYYLTIKRLLDYYEEYNNMLSIDIGNDKENGESTIRKINSIKKSIMELLLSIKEMKSLYFKDNFVEETPIEEVQTSHNYVNLPILFPSRIKSVSECSNDIIEELRKNYGERSDLFLTQNIEDLTEFILQYPFGEIKKRAKKGNRSHSFNSILENKNGYCPLFKDYTVFKYKHDVATASRLSYMMLHISDNNKIRLQQEFNMINLENICLVLNFDASVLGDKEYVTRTHSLLKRDIEYINHIIELFKYDFKTEEDYQEAVNIINESIKEINALKDNYYNIERSI